MRDTINKLHETIDTYRRNAQTLRDQASSLDDECDEILVAIMVLERLDEPVKADAGVLISATVVDKKPLTLLNHELTKEQLGELKAGKVFFVTEAGAAPVTPPEVKSPPTVETPTQETASAPKTPEQRFDKAMEVIATVPVSEKVDLRAQPWSEERKAGAKKAMEVKRKGVVQKGVCPLSIKGNNLLHAGVFLDELDQDERFMMVDLIRDFGFEVLRSMMRGLTKPTDKVVQSLRSVIPRSLEIIDTGTGWKLQNKEATA